MIKKVKSSLCFTVSFFLICVVIKPLFAQEKKSNMMRDVAFKTTFSYSLRSGSQPKDTKLVDSKSDAVIPNNEIILVKGEQLLVRCPKGYKYLFDTNEQINPVLTREEAVQHYGWDVWYNTFEHGPYFCFKAEQPGSVFVGIYMAHEYFLYKDAVDFRGPELGGITVNVINE